MYPDINKRIEPGIQIIVGPITGRIESIIIRIPQRIGLDNPNIKNRIANIVPWITPTIR
jgi:hypothetical protein